MFFFLLRKQDASYRARVLEFAAGSFCLARPEVTIWAVDHVRNFGWVNMGGELRALGVTVDAVVVTLYSLRFKSAVLLAHRPRANARTSYC
jgi:hypothetical protein